MVRDGKGVKSARKALRLKQTELAGICGVRAETLSRIENNRENVPDYLDLVLALFQRDESAVRFAMERKGMSA